MLRITRTRLPLAALVVAAAAAVASIAGLASAGNEHSAAAVTKAATGRFHNLSAAERAGYALFPDARGIKCIDNQPVGGMGVHYVNGSLVGDTVRLGAARGAGLRAERGRAAEAGRARVHRLPAGLGRGASGSALALRDDVQPHPRRQPVRHPRLLLPPCLGVGAELERAPAALEPARALLSRRRRAGVRRPWPFHARLAA